MKKCSNNKHEWVVFDTQNLFKDEQALGFTFLNIWYISYRQILLTIGLRKLAIGKKCSYCDIKIITCPFCTSKQSKEELKKEYCNHCRKKYLLFI